MVVDSSVLLQILFDEPGAVDSLHALAAAGNLKIAAPTLLETQIVYASAAGFTSGAVSELVRRLRIDAVPFTEEHADEAMLAYQRFGKGQGHPARHNFGDCISYALASSLNEPLAFKGEDFSKTDLHSIKLG